VVEVRVREQDERERLRIERGGRPVALAKLFQALEQPAIDEDARAVVLQEVLRARDGAGRPQKLNCRHERIVTSAPVLLAWMCPVPPEGMPVKIQIEYCTS